MELKNKKWWHESVIYQIYPRSFQDSDGDGIGDLQGIIQRLDYLEKLGIDAIWLSPVYESPQDDNGYDISDYYAIDPTYGTMEDFDELVRQAKKRDIGIIMDLVVNHTSDEHFWFQEAKKSKDNPYHDYYVWADGEPGQVPNDLTSTFSGSAWEWNEDLSQYYLHLFSKKQPDLNWENEDMRQEIYQMMNFWLDKGIAGFRLDVIDLIGKIPEQKIKEDGPKLHDYLQEMNQATFGRGDYLTVGETWSATPESAELYSAPDREELSMVFQFEHIGIDQVPDGEKWDLAPFSVPKLKEVLTKWQTQLQEGWNSLFWNNHDLPRIISRWGNDQDYREKSGKALAILLHLLKGTPYIYQGEEIGMTNCPVTSIDQVNDIESRNMYAERLSKGYAPEDILASINTKGRDNARTPMQWSEEESGGFTTGHPWLALNPNYTQINADQALKNPDSLFYTYQKLIQLRREHPVIIYGDYELIADTSDQVYAYYRQSDEETLLVLVNLSDQAQEFVLEDALGSLLISNTDKDLQVGSNQLDPYDAWVYQVSDSR